VNEPEVRVCYCWCRCGHSKFSHEGPEYNEGPYGEMVESYGVCFHICDDCWEFDPVETPRTECDYCSPEAA
jgi:hypothetical protein